MELCLAGCSWQADSHEGRGQWAGVTLAEEQPAARLIPTNERECGGGRAADRGLWVCLGSLGKGNCCGPRVGLAPGSGPRAGQGQATWGQRAEGDVGTTGASLGSGAQNGSANSTSGF